MKDNWPEIFPTVEITARGEVQVLHTGLTGKGIAIR